jgi:uncharacterized protein (DUF488 family)
MASEARNPFFTIGHSTRSIPELVQLLEGAEVRLLADVRSIPRSRANPQYDIDALPASLAPFAIQYEHFAELGGRRGRRAGVAAETNAYWTHPAFHNYADYAASDEFRSGLERLRARGHEERTAIMCAEAVWWRCHRRIITDYLIAAGETVFHIMGNGRIDPASMTPAARVTAPGVVTYPPD